MSYPEAFRPTEVFVRRDAIATAVMWVCNRVRYTSDRPSMNPRTLSERFDDGVMGEIASIAVMQFLSDHGRHVLAYDQIRKDHYQEPDAGWDILSATQPFDEWTETSSDVKIKPSFAHSFSVKSSRIPQKDHDDINVAISDRDFKIFKKSNEIRTDLTADFEVQVYYKLDQSKYSPHLVITSKDIEEMNIDDIILKLDLQDRYGQCYLSGAASKEALIRYSNSLPEEKRF